jgi:SAM-dependent methyltransferase
MHEVGEYTLTVMKKAEWYNHWLLSFFSKYIRNSILEIGAGIGNFTSLLAEYGKVTAIDINKKYLNNIHVNGVETGFGDIEKGKYFFRNKKFNTIMALNVIEHIEDDVKAFRNIFDLLEKGGKFILLVPAHNALFSNYDKLLGHYRRYDITTLKLKLEKCGFKIDEIRYINWWGAIGWLVFIKLFNSRKMPENPVSIFDKLGKIFLLPERIINPPFGLSV